MEATLVTRLVTALKALGFKSDNEHRFLLGLVLLVEYLARQSPKNQARQSFVGMFLEAIANLVQMESIHAGVIIPPEGNEDTLVEDPVSGCKAKLDTKATGNEPQVKTKSSPCAKYKTPVLDADISDHRGHVNVAYNDGDRDVIHIMEKDLDGVGYCFVASDALSQDGTKLCKGVHLMPALGIGVVYQKNEGRASTILREFPIYPGDQIDKALERVWEKKRHTLFLQRARDWLQKRYSLPV